MKHKTLLGILVSIALLLMGAIATLMDPEIQSSGTGDDSSDVSIGYKGHVDVYLIRAGTDKAKLITSKDNLLVDNGKNYIRWQIGNGTAAANSNTKWISLSNDATAPQAGWTNIPSEITANGLGRAAGTYSDNGTGAWNYTYTWTATGAQSAQLTGLNYGGTANDGKLFAALQFTSVNLQSNDQLKVIWSISVS